MSVPIDSVGRVTYSAVLATHNNMNDAKDLYRSLESQSIPLERLEIIIVDDGSTDSKLRIASEWQSETQLNVRIISQDHLGIAKAMNAGIKSALGEWIVFIDSDSVLHSDFFKNLERFRIRDKEKRASMLCAPTLVYSEDKGGIIDNYPLGWKFKQGDRLVGLNSEPHALQVNIHASAVRRHVVTEMHPPFESETDPNFMEMGFITRYLSHFDEPILGLVATAKSYCRERLNDSPENGMTASEAEHFITCSEKGAIGLLRYVTKQCGTVPPWVQNLVLYNTSRYLMADRSWNRPLASAPQDILDKHWRTLVEILKYIETQTIREFALVNLGWNLSEGLLRYFRNEAWLNSDRYVTYIQPSGVTNESVTKLVYSYSGPLPEEEFFIDDHPVEPSYTKSIRHDLFGVHLMNERILALPGNGAIRIFLDSKETVVAGLPSYNRIPEFRQDLSQSLRLEPESDLEVEPRESNRTSRTRNRIAQRIWDSAAKLHSRGSEEAWITDASNRQAELRIILRAAGRWNKRYKKNRTFKRDQHSMKRALSPRNSEKYQDAWIFIDRPDRADDNAEHLYRHVLRDHPEINSWFMIRRFSDDWSRLLYEGFRLIPYGEDDAAAAVLNAHFIVSSHMDDDVYVPIDSKRFGRINATRIFLQHGITMNDISKWINTKNLGLVIACSPDELKSFVEDESYYRLTRQQVKLTGFPRHDSLVDIAENSPIRDRRKILFVPTWRKELVSELGAAESDEQRKRILMKSEFYLGWSELLNNEVFMSTVEAQNMRPIFVLHDHLAVYRNLFSFDEVVEIRSFADMSVQGTLASSRIVITDYSSIGIEAAISGAAVFYYQFDSQSIYDGRHTFGRSWFSYSDNGVGPVCHNVDAVIGELVCLQRNDWNVSDIYVERLRSLLPMLDGKASARVVRELKALQS